MSSQEKRCPCCTLVRLRMGSKLCRLDAEKPTSTPHASLRCLISAGTSTLHRHLLQQRETNVDQGSTHAWRAIPTRIHDATHVPTRDVIRRDSKFRTVHARCQTSEMMMSETSDGTLLSEVLVLSLSLSRNANPKAKSSPARSLSLSSNKSNKAFSPFRQ